MKDGRLLCEVAVNPINDDADTLPCELLVSEVFIIPVGEKEVEVAIVDEMLQNWQPSGQGQLQKHQIVYLSLEQSLQKL